jgi:hypothetical protein
MKRERNSPDCPDQLCAFLEIILMWWNLVARTPDEITTRSLILPTDHSLYSSCIIDQLISLRDCQRLARFCHNIVDERLHTLACRGEIVGGKGRSSYFQFVSGVKV